MSISGNATHTSLSGLQDALLRLNAAAQNIALSTAEGYRPVRVTSAAQTTGGVSSGVQVLADASVLSDYGGEGVQLLLARQAYQANARAASAALATERALLDAFGESRSG